MRIALIRPGLGLRDEPRLGSLCCQEPSALAVLAALTPQTFEVVAIDDRFEPVPYDQPWDLVALSVGTFHARRAYEIADRFRAQGIPVVLGGFHITLCPDEAASHADALALGEAEGTWPTILADAEQGALKSRYRCPDAITMAGVIPDRRIFTDKRYAPISVIQYGRGCRFTCEFCSIRAFYRGRCYERPIAEVLTEIQRAGRRRLFFADDNLLSHRTGAKELLRALIPLGVRWSAQLSIDVADDPELLMLMQLSGCQAVVIGFESLSSTTLRAMGKGWAKPEGYAQALARLRAHGIMVYGTFVFGYDDDTPDTVADALAFAMKERLFMANFNHLQPYPGTRLYERLQQEHRLRYERWWLDPRYRFGEAVFEPRGMSAAALADACHKARTAFHSFAHMTARAWERQANSRSLDNVVTFAVANLLSRRDIKRKHALPLGSGKPPLTPSTTTLPDSGP